MTRTVCIFLICTTAVLFFMCVAAALFIIKLLKARNAYNFYTKENTRLYHLAFKDDLTDLFNRNAYIRDLAKMQEQKLGSLWFVLFDIDDFKSINDTKGHLYGDTILMAAAERLCRIFADKCHTVYRIGGDEFLVISKNISEGDLITLLLRLKHEEEEKDDFRFSKGYAAVENMGHEHFDLAFDSADKMLYADKHSKKRRANS